MQNLEIKTIEFLNSSIQYYLGEDGAIYISGKDFCSIIFGSSQYHHKKDMASNYDFNEVGKDQFFELPSIEDKMLTYEVQKSTYDKDPSKYENYVRFMDKGGVNYLFKLIVGQDPFEPMQSKDISDLLEDRSLRPDCLELEDEINNLNFLVVDLEAEKVKLELVIEKLSVDTNNLKLENEDFQTALNDAISKNASLNVELAELKKYKQSKESKKSIKDWLTSPKLMLYATISAISIFMPFTVMALLQYIAIPSSNIFASIGITALCILIAAAWDFSILLFTVNGRKVLATMGSIFQFIFISAKFNFFSSWIDLVGWDGAVFQKMIVITAIVIYSPILIYQFAELANRK